MQNILCPVLLTLVTILSLSSRALAFQPVPIRSRAILTRTAAEPTKEVAESAAVNEIVELNEDDDGSSNEQKAVAPFQSQGEISPDALNPDLTDPQETRVILYMIISLIPVLFLIPLMLGSRDLIPLDAIPPVDM